MTTHARSTHCVAGRPDKQRREVAERVTNPGRISAVITCIVAALGAPLTQAGAQHQESPVVPSSTIGPVTNSSTLSLLGVAALPEGGSMGQRNLLWFGATQPLARIAGVRLAAIGSGFYRASETVGSRDAAEGIISLRALARIGGTRTWTAVSYGHSEADAGPTNGINESLTPNPTSNNGFNELWRADSTINRRSDIGTITRAEAGVLTSSGAVEFSFGVSLERAERVTRHSQSVINVENVGVVRSHNVHRSVERRDFATGMASAGFRSGDAHWLLSFSAPLKSWAYGDDDAPSPRRMPAIASIAVVQPLTEWLSVVGSASTNATTVGSYALRDAQAGTRERVFSPVLAFGVRIARFSLPNRTGEPGGVLAFETRTIGIIDSITSQAIEEFSADPSGRELVRVLLVIDAPRSESVELMGDATAWTITSMSRARDGKWRAELRVSPGMHRIAVRADGGAWMAPPGLPIGNDDFGESVGLLVVKLRSY